MMQDEHEKMADQSIAWLQELQAYVAQCTVKGIHVCPYGIKNSYADTLLRSWMHAMRREKVHQEQIEKESLGVVPLFYRTLDAIRRDKSRDGDRLNSLMHELDEYKNEIRNRLLKWEICFGFYLHDFRDEKMLKPKKARKPKP